MIKQSRLNRSEGWAFGEFGEAKFGDTRLTTRLIKLADDLAELPESSINQASGSWAEAKAAYRFFQNDSILESEILSAHVAKTVERASHYETILSIQDTTYISYKKHSKTTGLGIIASRIRSQTTNFKTPGLVMHTAFAITTEGLPIGLLDQKIHSRPPIPEEKKELKKKSHGIALAIQDKESIRWLDSLKKSKDALGLTNVQLVTVCDREGDIYDFFEFSEQLNSPVLVRARQDRKVNKPSRCSKKSQDTLWGCIKKLPIQGSTQVDIPARDNKPARIAKLDIQFGSFTMNPPRNNIRHRTEELPNLKLQAVYALEKNPPPGDSPLEWMLLTNLPVENFKDALEKVHWYCLRWRIEVFHKILKSGLHVEECRLGTAQRLMRYLTVMSVIAWRIFFITLLARTNPDFPCTVLLAEEEWKTLYSKIHQTRSYPETPPTIKSVIKWIAQLGGFLARKGDGDPGPITLWRGWKRLVDLSEGWNLARL